MKPSRAYISTAALAAFLLYAITAPRAIAENLPWLSDPFRTEKKISEYGAKIRPAVCQPQSDLTHTLVIGEVVLAALCHNPSTRADYLGLLADAANYGSNYSAYLPSVAASGSAGRSMAFFTGGKSIASSSSSGFSAGMTLYDFGRREATIEAAEWSLVAAGHNYDSGLQGLLATTLQSYYKLLASQDAVVAAKEAEKFAEASYEAARTRHAIGLVPLADELQAKGNYSQAILSSEQTANQLEQDRGTLAVLMGLSPSPLLNVAEVDNTNLTNAPFGGAIAELMAEAKKERADLIAKRSQFASSEASLTALKRSQYPSVAVSTGVGFERLGFYNDTRGGRSQSVGLSVSIPIFTGFSYTYSERAAEHLLAAQRENLVQAELDVEQDVWRSWHNYQTSAQSWETSLELLASATQLKDVALGRYKEGLGTILDVLGAESQYRSALQSNVSARYNLLVARVDLVRAVGVLDLDSMRPNHSASPPPPTEGPHETQP